MIVHVDSVFLCSSRVPEICWISAHSGPRMQCCWKMKVPESNHEDPRAHHWMLMIAKCAKHVLPELIPMCTCVQIPNVDTSVWLVTLWPNVSLVKWKSTKYGFFRIPMFPCRFNMFCQFTNGLKHYRLVCTFGHNIAILVNKNGSSRIDTGGFRWHHWVQMIFNLQIIRCCVKHFIFVCFHDVISGKSSRGDLRVWRAHMWHNVFRID